MINREQFLQPREMAVKDVDIPGLGVVRISELSKSQHCKFELWLRPKGDFSASRYAKRDQKLICLSVLDSDNQPMFDAEEDMDAIGKQPGPMMDALAHEVKLLNGFITVVDDDKKVDDEEDDVDELLGKSDS